MELSTMMRNGCDSCEFHARSLIVPQFKTTTKVVFTDQSAPSGVEVQDVSQVQDGGVVRWGDGNTYFFSTQRKGVKVAAPKNCSKLFAGLENLKVFDGTMLDMSEVWITKCMFANCTSLVEIVGLEAWNMSHVRSMAGMFLECCSLENIDGLQTWNVGNVENLSGMFLECTNIKDWNCLKDWNVSNVKTMRAMFEHCVSFKNVDVLSKWSVNNVEDMGFMFSLCCYLKNIDGLADWDVSWDVDNKEKMDGMFFGCPHVTTKPTWYHV